MHPSNQNSKPILGYADPFVHPVRSQSPLGKQISSPHAGFGFPYSQSSNFLPQAPNLSFDQFISTEKSINSTISTITQSQKLNKQAQLLNFKQKAKEKEQFMMLRKKSAIRIQAAFKGWKQRKKFKMIWERHQRKRKLDRLRIIAQRIKVLFAPYVIFKALKSWVEVRREEKLRVLIMFKEYSAVYIQRVWRGYCVRQKFKAVIGHKLKMKNRLKGLIKGWKIRKIFRCREISGVVKGIHDLEKLKNELYESGQNDNLLAQITTQVPVMKSKLIKEIFRLYRQGTWVKSLNAPSPQKFEAFAAVPFVATGISPIRSRDDQQVKPCTIEFDEFEETVTEQPKSTFKNFLRRGQNTKYTPKLPHAKLKSPVAEEQEDTKPPQEVLNAKIAQETEDYDNVKMELETNDKPKHDFLKRKSQTYKPTKLEWKVKNKVDCWGETAIQEPKAKKPSKKKTTGGLISFTRVQELEFIFANLNRSHVPTSGHFGTLARMKNESLIPQITPQSFFITNFDEDSYQKTFERLQNHYLHLCNEDEVSD